MKETNLKVKHQRKAAYKQLFSDALPLNSYGEALQVKNERFCQLFKLANKRMNQKNMCIYSPMPHTLSYCALIGKCALIRSNTVFYTLTKSNVGILVLICKRTIHSSTKRCFPS